MKYKYFLNLYVFCSLLGITPFYSFKKAKLVKQTLNKLWLTILLAYRFCLLLGYFLMSVPKFENEYSIITIKVLEHPSHVSYWIMPFSTVLMLLINCKKWEQFLLKLMRINDLLPRKTGKRRYTKHVLNFTLNMIILAYMFLQKENYFTTEENAIHHVWYFMYNNLEEIFWLYTNIFINEIMLNLKDRYEVLNQKLVKTVDKSVENKFMNKGVTFDTVEQIKKIKCLYRDLNELVEHTNFLLGWPIFCLMTYTLLDTLSILNCLIIGEDLEWLSADIVELFLIIIYNVYVALTCDLTKHEGSKIIKLLFNLEENFPMKSPIREELAELAEQAKYFAPKFISVGLFEVNRRMLLSIVTTITTYVIVIIQFNNIA